MHNLRSFALFTIMRFCCVVPTAAMINMPCDHLHSTQQLAQLLMQCLAKGQSKPQSFANMDQAGLRQKYEEMQVKCHEFKVGG